MAASQKLPKSSIFPAFISFSPRLLFWRFPVLEEIYFNSDVVCDSGVREGEAPPYGLAQSLSRTDPEGNPQALGCALCTCSFLSGFPHPGYIPRGSW